MSVIAFENAELEKRFFAYIKDRQKQEVGGVFFYHWSQVADLHWKRHIKIFGERGFWLIKHWLICPNTSNLADRQYEVSDLKQFIGIAEQTADSLCMPFMHFHTHPNGSVTPSNNDLLHWLQNWSLYYSGSNESRAAIASVNRIGELVLASHDVKRKADKIDYHSSNFARWQYINHRIRRDERERAKKLKGE